MDKSIDYSKKNETKTWVRSIVFVILFWTITALYMYGLYCLMNVIDLTTIIKNVFAA